jgi:long-chain acyl-CoA synthetase
MGIFNIIERAAFKHMDKVVLIHQGETVTYSNLMDLVYLLEQSISKQFDLKNTKVIPVMWENSIDCMLILLALLKLEKTIALIPSDKLKIDNAISIINQIHPSIIFIQNFSHELFDKIISPGLTAIITENENTNYTTVYTVPLKNLLRSNEHYDTKVHQSRVPLSKNKEAFIIFTSGSSGTIKGVVLSHDNIAKNAYSVIKYLKLKDTDRTYLALPISYIYGLSVAMTHMFVGGSILIDNMFWLLKNFKNQVNEHQITNFSGVPWHYIQLLMKTTYSDIDLRSIRFFTQAGGAMQKEHVLAIRERFPSILFYIMYGQTESRPRISYLSHKWVDRKPDSIGKPIPNVRIKILTQDGKKVKTNQEGELLCKGPGVMQGYWHSPEETQKKFLGKWLRTGDIVRKEQDGFLFLVRRNDELIKINGYRVSRSGMERELINTGMFDNIAISVVHDANLGDTIFVAAVLNKKAKEPIARNLLQAKYHVIGKNILFMDELPILEGGKINYQMISIISESNQTS